MTAKLSILTLITVLILGQGGVAQAKAIKIVADGDSVTAYPNNYTGYFASDLAGVQGCGPVTVVNVAQSGQSQASMLARQSTFVLPEKPDIVTLCTYLNDIGTPRLTLISNIVQYVNTLLAITNKVTWLPPQLILMTDNFAGQAYGTGWARPSQAQYDTAQIVLEAYQLYAGNPNVQIVDNFASFYALGVDTPALYAKLLTDQVHPNVDGYVMYHENMSAALIHAAQRVVESATNHPPTVVTPASVVLYPIAASPAVCGVSRVTAFDKDGDTLRYSWSQVSGPGIVTFGTANAAESTVSFSATGAYVLRVTITDGQGGTNTSEVGGTFSAAHKNTIPFQETFEGLSPGADILVTGNLNGWYGNLSAAACVTQLVCSRSTLLYPVESATHSNVLTLNGSQRVIQFETNGIPGATTNATVDFLVLSEGCDGPAEASFYTGAQVSFYIDTNGALNVWHGLDGTGNNNVWTTFSNAPVDTTVWSRVTVAFDYTGDAAHGGPGDAFFKVYLNGIGLTPPGAIGYGVGAGPGYQQNGGKLLRTANPHVKQVQTFECKGNGLVDDIVVTPAMVNMFFRKFLSGTILSFR